MNNSINPNFIIVNPNKPEKLILGDSKDKDPFGNVSFNNLSNPVIITSQIKGNFIDYKGNKIGTVKYDELNNPEKNNNPMG